MNLVQRIRQLYHGSGRAAYLQHDLDAHLARGYIFKTPDAMLMGFRCRSDDIRQAIHDRGTINIEQADEAGCCWFVWLAVGDIVDLLRFVPRPAEYVAFSRRGQLRIWRMAELERRVVQSRLKECPCHGDAEMIKVRGSRK